MRRAGGARRLPSRWRGSRTGHDAGMSSWAGSSLLPVNIGQLVDAASAVGLPPVVYPLERLRAAGPDVEPTICRYPNS